MNADAEGRLAAILCRELGAASVRFSRPEEAPEPSDRLLLCPIGDGPTVIATFDEPPADREAKERRMEMIVASFADLLAAAPGDAHRHKAPARSLGGELSALAGRAGALAALVVDARSPVIWGASDLLEGHDDEADETETTRLYRKAAAAGLHFKALVSEPVLDIEGDSSSRDLELSGEGPVAHDEDELSPEERAEFWRRVLVVRNALAAVRALPHVVNLHKGEHLHETVRAPELSYVVKSFATIYMLLLVFERPFDELRAERSVAHALPTIQRLVLALPPTEPTPPTAGVGVVRLRRR
jgi:hypothetical protein